MPIKSMKDAKCFITGAASGIGRATAVAAAAQGAELFLTDLNGVALKDVADQIRADGGKVSFAEPADISDFEAVQALGEAVHDAVGSVDVVMNIAGVSTWGSVDKLEHRHWKQMVDVNLMGPIHVIETFIPPMIEAGHDGYLVNVSSAAGLLGLPWHAAYSASKFGLRGVSEVLRFDLQRHGIGVSLVCPGGVDTPLVGSVEIVGVDRDSPQVKRMMGLFQKVAVSPEKVADCILDGVQKNKYLVFTSNDIRVGYFFQSKFPWPYRIAMRVLNDRFTAVARAS